MTAKTTAAILPTVNEQKQSLLAIEEAVPVSLPKTSTATEGHKEASDCLSSTLVDACLDWVVFPSLLFVQFGATMVYEARMEKLVLDWCTVLFTIALFCLVAGLYRWIFRMHASCHSLILMLLPEIFTNVVLAAVMFGTLALAYQTLVAATFILILLGSLGGVHLLVNPSASSTSYSAAYDYQVLEDQDVGGEEAC